jgi:hypothetical protein
MASMTRTPTAGHRGATSLRRGRVAHGLVVAAVALMLWLLSAPRLHAQTPYEWRGAVGAPACSGLSPRLQDGVLPR